ncbi:MAG TPA: TylF/MycF/NovP-related O-methyltransferase [Longimicrobiales bacterium]|nr:TylF/MycF/NovP-related O-methyltransferase [Longimicrobiales bacterium]
MPRVSDHDSCQRCARAVTGTSRGRELRDHFGAVHGRRADVERLLAGYAGVHLHAGVFPDSASALAHERFSFVHLDLDLEPSTRDALAFFQPRLLPGGILVGDDYDFPGVRSAFASWYAGSPDTLVELPWGQVIAFRAGP